MEIEEYPKDESIRFLEKIYQRFGGVYCLNLQGTPILRVVNSNTTTNVETASSSKTTANIYQYIRSHIAKVKSTTCTSLSASQFATVSLPIEFSHHISSHSKNLCGKTTKFS